MSYGLTWFSSSNKKGEAMKDIATKGERYLLSLKENAQITINSDLGNCYKLVVSSLEKNCQNINEFEKGKLAVALTNCHMAKSGQRTYKCTTSMTLDQCVSPMAGTPIAFNAYTEFTTHVDHICWFLQQEVMQEKTEKIVNFLVMESVDLQQKLADMNSKATTSLKELDTISERQRKIFEEQHRIKQTLDTLDEKESQHFKNVFQKVGEVFTVSQKLNNDLSTIASNQNDVLVKQSEISKENAKIMNGMEKNYLMSDKIYSKQHELDENFNKISEKQSNFLQNIEKKQDMISTKQAELLEIQQKIDEKNLKILESLTQRFDEIQSKMDSLFDKNKASLMELLATTQETSQRIKEHQNEVLENNEKLFKALSKLINFNTFFFTEFLNIQTFIFYFGFIGLQYFLTSPKQTNSARIWVFLLISINFLAEKIILSRVTQISNIDNVRYFISECRKVVCLISAGMLCFAFYNYRDYSEESWKMLNKMFIHRQTMFSKMMQNQKKAAYHNNDYTQGTYTAMN